MKTPFSQLSCARQPSVFAWHQKLKIFFAHVRANTHLCVVCSERIGDDVSCVKSPLCFLMILSLQTGQNNPLLVLLILSVMNRYSWFEDKSLLTWRTWSIICDLNKSTSAGESGIKFGAIVFIGDLRTLVMNSAFIHFTTKYIDGLKLATHTMLQVAHVMNAGADRWGHFKGHDTGVMRGN